HRHRVPVASPFQITCSTPRTSTVAAARIATPKTRPARCAPSRRQASAASFSFSFSCSPLARARPA
ncbi:hypothetical protein, partial [Burkholderia gladioli]|uniref:hypothetical protein n=1 Tax=Burkholderia gladioli TaxID=28095 RepID=UPI001F41611F